MSRIPKISRRIMFLGSPVPSAFTQMYSDRLTLLSASSLCRSQNSYGPKKFQLGPRRNVPMMINRIQSTKKPNWNVR